MTGGCVFDRRIFINYLLNYPVSYISAKKNDPSYLNNLSTTKNGNIKVFDEDISPKKMKFFLIKF